MPLLQWLAMLAKMELMDTAQQLPLMTEPFGMGVEKMYYCLIKPMLSENVISKQAQIMLEEYIFFCNAFPSVLLKYFAFQEVYCPKGLTH